MIIDIIIILVLVLSAFLGYKKGLIELGVKLCAIVIALLVTLVLYRPISSLIINTTNLDETIEQIIINKSTELLNAESTKDMVQGTIATEVQNKILPSTAKEISLNIIRTIVMLILYLLTKIILRFVTALANLVAKLPILSQFNKLGGLLFGIIRGLAYIYIILLIISFVYQINPTNRGYIEIEKSTIGKQMYKYNIINMLVK